MHSQFKNQSPVYWDHAATTPVDYRVLEEMWPTFGEHFGNPGSRVYGRGLQAEALVDLARDRVATLMGARSVEVTFTSGSTESNNLALAGWAASHGYNCHVVVSATEHPSVLEVAESLVVRGASVSVLPVDEEGRVVPRVLDKVLRELRPEENVLVSVMHANNETGTLNPVEAIGAICRRHGAFFHCDASQTMGKVPVDVEALQVDLLSLSAHKFYGPKGVGALYLRRQKPRLDLKPLAWGGGQERGLRSGTLNVPGIVGLGAAALVAGELMKEESEELRRLTNLMVACLSCRLPGVRLNGSRDHRLPGSLNLSFRGVSAEPLQVALRSVVEFSAGSACSTGKMGASHVMVAMGLSSTRAEEAVRFTFGRFTTEDEVHRVMDAIVPAVEKIRGERGYLAQLAS